MTPRKYVIRTLLQATLRQVRAKRVQLLTPHINQYITIVLENHTLNHDETCSRFRSPKVLLLHHHLDELIVILDLKVRSGFIRSKPADRMRAYDLSISIAIGFTDHLVDFLLGELLSQICCSDPKNQCPFIRASRNTSLLMTCRSSAAEM